MKRSDTDNYQREIVTVQAGEIPLEGSLIIPREARGIVIFAHGSGSSRHSSRNRFVAEQLNENGMATLLFDLLTAEEEKIDVVTRELRFDIGLLAERVQQTVDWVGQQSETSEMNIGLFGASTGAAAALIAAANRPEAVQAVVSRGGRPDLAKLDLHRVGAPTLLIVGGEDLTVIEMNQMALDQLQIEEKELKIIPGATHLFEEAGKLEEVARLAADWFKAWLRPVKEA